MTPGEIVEIFDRNVPEAFQRDTLELLIRCYPTARHRLRDRFDEPQVENLIGHERCALFDQLWKEAADSFSEISGITKSNKNGAYYYTQVNAGGVCLTASHVDHRTKKVRAASYRNSLAVSSQLLLWPTEDSPPKDAPLYALLIHGSDPSRASEELGFAEIRFPLADGKYHEARINLMERFELTDFSHVEEEIIADTLEPELLPNQEPKPKVESKKGDVGT